MRGRRPVGPGAAVAVAAGLLAACGGEPGGGAPAPGVPRELADWRARALDSVRYDLRFSVPDSVSEPVVGRARIRFVLRDRSRPLVLDFAGAGEKLRRVRLDGESVRHRTADGHVIVPAGQIPPGASELELSFVAGDGPLNRNAEYLYTLFVPARAHEAFPCFDQPNLKARFRLTLEVPAGWRAVSNTPVVETGPSPGEAGKTAAGDGPAPGEGGATAAGAGAIPAGAGATGDGGGRRVVGFAPTRRLPTYLFAFAAGRFRVEEAPRGGRTLRMYHREPDTSKVARNRERVFDLHATALDWLEEYTGIGYPFEKFSFVLVPSFQYGGMEHPGAVYYRASEVLLDESATQNDRLGRASLIAHETAHMWFGDLVTMRWFNDVWMKEVFANFMAAKIVHPSFPDVDHDLRFLLDHYPAAYSVDRTEGTHPIRRPLENLSEAGTLYGALIYHKAPIAMRQLERLVGEGTMRRGLRSYLERGRFGNAGWPDLVSVLDELSGEDLEAWSRTWIEEAGRPGVSVALEQRGDSAVRALRLRQRDPMGKGRTWNQRLRPALGYRDTVRYVRAHLAGRTAAAPAARGMPVPDWVLPNGGGLGYGRFTLDPRSRRALLDGLPGIDDPVTRAAGWLTLWDGMLARRVEPEELLRLALESLSREANEQVAETLLGDLGTLYWRYLTDGQRRRWAPRVERRLWAGLQEADGSSLKAAYFEAYRRAALTDSAVGRLRTIWREERKPAGIELSDRDYSDLAQQLAVRGVPGSREILREQAERIDNPDRRERFRWVMPSLSPEESVRDSVFRSLKRAENRRHEPWVLEAARFLHHPLRADPAIEYIRPSLELLREIQATGDIFFPKGWVDATLSGHQTPAAARIVRDFLAGRPDYPEFLRDKVLQAADPLFRAALITSAPE